MKKNELSAKFNKHLTAAVAEGFSPCLTELRGSYSDVFGSQLVLAKDNERIVMWMEENKEYSRDAAPDTIKTYVSRFSLAKGESTDRNYMWPSEWKKHLVDETTSYVVSDRRDGWYVDDPDEAARARDLHWDRLCNSRHASDFREYEVNGRILAIARRIKGFKTIKPENLRVHKVGKTWHFVNMRSRNEVCLGG